MAKIVGGVIATPNPIPDWEQTNPNRADYIKNKPNKLANAITGTVTGNDVVQLGNVSPIEHELAVTVSRRNLLDIAKSTVPTNPAVGLSFEMIGDVVRVYGTMTQCSNYASLVILHTDNQPELSGKGYVIQAFDADTNALITESSHKIRVYGIRTAGENAIAITITNSVTGLVVDYRFRFVVSEEEQTSYVPYIADLGEVTVTSFVDDIANGFTEYQVNADGTVNGVKSISPNMTLATDTEGVTITAEYNMDTNAVLESEIVPRLIPKATTEDNGKILQVVDGEWAAVSLLTAENTAF